VVLDAEPTQLEDLIGESLVDYFRGFVQSPDPSNVPLVQAILHVSVLDLIRAPTTYFLQCHNGKRSRGRVF
jgi:hypothetical protein